MRNVKKMKKVGIKEIRDVRIKRYEKKIRKEEIERKYCKEKEVL